MIKRPVFILRGLCIAVACLASLIAPAVIAADAGTVVARSEQMILVISPDWNSSKARLRRFARIEGQWTPLAPAVPVVIGKSGAAWGLGLHSAQSGHQKREGDGRAPAGIFAIGPAFGYAQSVSTALEYKAMTAQDYCIDVSDSPLYNRIVDAAKVGEKAIAGSTEPMRRDLHADGDRRLRRGSEECGHAEGDQRYKLGLVIEHNAQHTPAAGSCIFAHLWKSSDSSTAGCTAMSEPLMRELLGWLDPAQRPLFILLPRAEYQRLRALWQLPDFDAPAPH